MLAHNFVPPRKASHFCVENLNKTRMFIPSVAALVQTVFISCYDATATPQNTEFRSSFDHQRAIPPPNTFIGRGRDEKLALRSDAAINHHHYN